MTRFAKGRWMALALPLLLSCAENDQTLRVIYLAEAPRGFGAGCTAAEASQSAMGVTRGILDLAAVDDFAGQVPVEYRVFPIIQNGLTVPGQGELSSLTPSPGVPPHTVIVSDVVTELNVGVQNSIAGPLKTVAGLSGPDLKFRTPVFTRLDGGARAVVAGVGVPESAVKKLAAVRSSILPNPADQIVITARVRIIGKKDGVDDIESSFVDLPIGVCNGCLYKNVGACDQVTAAQAAMTGSSCSPIQDYPLRCCSQDSTLVCPAAKPAMAGN